MKVHAKIFWLLYLAFFTAGCSGYRVVGYSLPEIIEEASVEEDAPQLLEPGDSVRVILQSGEQVKGGLLSLSSEALVLKSLRDGCRTIPADQIQSVELKELDGGKTALLILLTFGTLAAASLDDQSSSDGTFDWDWDGDCIGCK